MKESSTYQAILEEGREKGRQEGQIEWLHTLLLEWGTELLGQPSKRTQSALVKITDMDRLRALTKRLPTVESWLALLVETPSDRD